MEWFIRENPIKIDDLGGPLFLETPKLEKKLMINQFYCVMQSIPRCSM